MAENLRIYEAVRKVPQEAQKTIKGGRLGGMTDINPMWRIKMLTDQFGPCGIGWYYEITDQWIADGANGETAAFCNINLYTRHGDEWSKPIPGTGGASFIAKEKNGLYTSDECFKMALTDAISVACKALGMGADVYWDKDRTKYDQEHDQPKTISAADIMRAELRQWYTDAALDKASQAKFGTPFAELSDDDVKRLHEEVKAGRAAKAAQDAKR